ncbi:MAG: hypothetical protein LLF76_05635 [Planctomycetaceae bacterium]|nr:hypothetical protein [Planctomycetaceae bacterium]
MKKEKSEKTPATRSPLRFWGRAICLLTVLGVVGVLRMCRYKPGEYLPTAPANPQQVSPYLTHKLGPDFFNQVQLEEPFILEVEQAGLNDIISRWPWPQPLGDAQFSNPVIVFSEGTIQLMGRLEYKGISSVLLIQAEPFQTQDGQVNLNIQSIRLGMLPVTKLVAKLAKMAFQENLSAFEGEPQAEAAVRAIINNEAFDPIFAISRNTVKVTDFSLKDRLLTMTCVPSK